MNLTPFRAEKAFEPDKPKSEEPSDDKLTREWYTHTSWEGRSPREFEDLRREVSNAPSLDFERYFHDKDYQRLIHENHRMKKFVVEEEAISLMALWDKTKQVGISPGQFERLVSAFSPEALDRFRRTIATEEVLRTGYAAMSAEDAKDVHAAITDRMERTIEKQKMKDVGQQQV